MPEMTHRPPICRTIASNPQFPVSGFQIPDPKFKIPALKFQSPITKFQSPVPKIQIAISKLQIPNQVAGSRLSFQIPVLKLQIAGSKFQFPVLNFQFQICNFKFQISSDEWRLASLLLAVLLVLTLHGFAQAPPKPYAVIPRDAVNYSGPGRDAHHDLQGSEIKIGFLAPLTGPHPEEGKALLQAAQLAIEDEAASPLPEGRRLLIVPRDQSGPWGRASNEVVHLVYEDQAVAIVTSLDGGSAHLAEQVGNKVGIPVVTLSSDPTTTQINLPWIFRLGPTDAQQARAFARDIYVARKLKQVILITENGHDGRVGGEQFEKAARELNAPPVIQLAIDPADWNPDSVAKQIAAQKPDAVVFWTGHESAARLVPRFRSKFPTAPVYLCQEAAQGRFEEQRPSTVNARSGLRRCPTKPHR